MSRVIRRLRCFAAEVIEGVRNVGTRGFWRDLRASWSKALDVIAGVGR